MALVGIGTALTSLRTSPPPSTPIEIPATYRGYFVYAAGPPTPRLRVTESLIVDEDVAKTIERVLHRPRNWTVKHKQTLLPGWALQREFATKSGRAYVYSRERTATIRVPPGSAKVGEINEINVPKVDLGNGRLLVPDESSEMQFEAPKGLIKVTVPTAERATLGHRVIYTVKLAGLTAVQRGPRLEVQQPEDPDPSWLDQARDHVRDALKWLLDSIATLLGGAIAAAVATAAGLIVTRRLQRRRTTADTTPEAKALPDANPTPPPAIAGPAPTAARRSPEQRAADVRLLLQAVRRLPGASSEELAAATGLPHAGVEALLKTLVYTSRIDTVSRPGGGVGYQLMDEPPRVPEPR